MPFIIDPRLGGGPGGGGGRVVTAGTDFSEYVSRQSFWRAGRFAMDFAQSTPAALQRISDATEVLLISILSDINTPGMSGLDLLPKAKAARPDVPIIMITT
jgi:CheY-like chemotaxis protein